MRKILFIAAAALLAMTACSKKDNTREAEQAAAEQTALAEEAVTGQSGTVTDLADDNTWRPDTKVDVLTVLDFNATWCGPCKQLKPAFETAAQAFPQARFVSVDVDRNPATAAAFEVEAVPTVIFFLPDGTQKKYIGTDELLPYEKLDSIVRASL